ncbi:MAG: hypothetical protein ACKO2K_18615 [Alphaproteobacteria bacterium]
MASRRRRERDDAAVPARAALEERFRRIALVGEAVGMLQWDMAAVMP